MAKKVITIDGDKMTKMLNRTEELSNREVEIKGASINDALCNYSYELLKGSTKGDTISHKGAHIIHDDLQICFDRLSVFLAHLDDAYTGNKDTTPLEELENEIETDNYHVTGFKLSGVEENKSVTLSGYKIVTNGIIKFETPRIKYSSLYLYLSELKERIQDALNEVESYRNGKTAPQDDPNQVHMSFEEEDAAFENAKLEQ